MFSKTLPGILAMSRPSQLLAVTLVYAFGLVLGMANGFNLKPVTALWGYLALIPVSASIHFINEYADHETDTLTERTPFSGGSGALQKYGLDRQVARMAAWISLGAGAPLAILGYAQGLTVGALLVLALGAFFGWMYSVRPLALAWNGLGEIDNAALGGVLLPIYGYVVLAGRLDLSALLAVTPFGLMVFINLLATTWPDRDADRAVGKFTLATHWSARRLRFLYWATAAATFILLPLLTDWILPPIVMWACLLTIPVVVWGATAYTRQHSPLPTVAAMIVMLATHLVAWATTIS